MTGETRICRTCLKELPISMYGVYQVANRAHKNHRLECKRCRAIRQSNRYHGNPDIKEKAKNISRKCRLLKEYGLSIDDFNKMYGNQNGKCCICSKFVEGTKINIDHCHKTGKVRGLLCWNCNMAIGYLKDNIDNLKNAIKYLEETK